MTSLPAKVLIAPIRFYQRFITPYTPATCRYHPTCSAYGVSALRAHGAIVGTGLTIWRLLRCNPWSSGGIDYVPARGMLWRRHTGDGQTTDGRDAERHSARPGEREAAAASSSTVCSAEHRPACSAEHRPACSAEHRSAGTDCTPDAPPSVAGDPMIGRSAA